MPHISQLHILPFEGTLSGSNKRCGMKREIICLFCGFSHVGLELFGESEAVLKDLDVIGGGRRLARCAECHSLERERLIAIFLSAQSSLAKSNERILHVAPEKNLARVLRRNGVHYTAIDLMTQRYSYPTDTKQADLTALPFIDSAFDLVVCNHVLEHIADDKRALSEIQRVLSPVGIAIIQVPIGHAIFKTKYNPLWQSETDRLREYGQRDHVRLYGRDYFHFLATSGLSVIRFQTMAIVDPKSCDRFGINPKEDIYVLVNSKCRNLLNIARFRHNAYGIEFRGLKYAAKY